MNNNSVLTNNQKITGKVLLILICLCLFLQSCSSNEIHTCEIQYINGTDIIADYKQIGKTYNIKDALFEKEGYLQTGWSLEENGEISFNFGDIYTTDANLTLYPVWEIQQFTITFDTDGGSPINPITQDFGTAITPPSNPTKEGSVFYGWDSLIPTTMPGHDVTIKALWSLNTFQISYNPGTYGTGSISSQEKTYGIPCTITNSSFERTGYTQIGWATSENGEKEYDFGASYVSDTAITLYPVWKPNTYSISYNLNGGVAVTPLTPTSYTFGVGGLLPTNTDLTKTGYTLAGWYEQASPQTVIYQISTTDIGNKEYYAKWTAITVSTTFYLNGGSISSSTNSIEMDQTYDSTYIFPEDPIREKYQFTGWYTSDTEGFQITSTTSVKITTHTNYYAQWTHTHHYIIEDEANWMTSRHICEICGDFHTPTDTDWIQTTCSDLPQHSIACCTVDGCDAKWEETSLGYVSIQLGEIQTLIPVAKYPCGSLNIQRIQNTNKWKVTFVPVQNSIEPIMADIMIAGQIISNESGADFELDANTLGLTNGTYHYIYCCMNEGSISIEGDIEIQLI